jgi:fatty-acyl-CoA synthase
LKAIPARPEKKLLRNVFQQGDVVDIGDLLRCDEDGYCWFVDRIGDTFRWKSENVSTRRSAMHWGTSGAGCDYRLWCGFRSRWPCGHGRVVMHEGAHLIPAFWELAISACRAMQHRCSCA